MSIEAQVACPPSTWLTVSPRPSGRCLVLVVTGEADGLTAPLLRQDLIAALNHGPERVIVDVTELTFCNLQGLDALHEAIEVIQQAGVPVTLRGMSRLLAWLHTTYPTYRRGVADAAALVPVG